MYMISKASGPGLYKSGDSLENKKYFLKEIKMYCKNNKCIHQYFHIIIYTHY